MPPSPRRLLGNLLPEPPLPQLLWPVCAVRLGLLLLLWRRGLLCGILALGLSGIRGRFFACDQSRRHMLCTTLVCYRYREEDLFYLLDVEKKIDQDDVPIIPEARTPTEANAMVEALIEDVLEDIVRRNTRRSPE